MQNWPRKIRFDLKKNKAKPRFSWPSDKNNGIYTLSN